MKTSADLRGHLKAGRTTIGSWIQLPDANVAELLAKAGYDWITVDLEHGRYTETSLPDIFRAIRCGGALPFARLGEVTAYRIKAALDAGAEGLILPMIQSAAELRQAISWAHYPPTGTRGVGYSAANDFGRSFETYRQSTNPFIVAQIEHKDAVDNIGAILEVEGLDAVMVGPYDLSASMNLTGKFDHPEFKQLLSRLLAACSEKNFPAGQHVVRPGKIHLENAMKDGYRFIAYCTDAIFLWSAAERPAISDK
jgi:2-dehydro-3-deoxyglucarate aldolase